MTKRTCIAVDNGHHAHKVYDHTGQMSQILSRASRGVNNTISMMGGQTTKTTFLADNVPYTCSDNLRMFEPVNPFTFPTSPLARVLLHHALNQHQGGKYRESSVLQVCTGLPLGRYLHNGTPKKDTKLVDAVEANLSGSVIVSTTDANGNVRESEVSLKVIAKPQTWVAWYAYVLEERRTSQDPSRPELIQHEDRKMEPMAIIDVGGGTTEICVVENGELDCNVSGSKMVGSNTIRDLLSKFLMEKFSMDSVTSFMLDQAMTTKKLRFDGIEHDVSKLYTDALNIASADIISFIDDKIGRRQREINAVRLIGGGCNEFSDAIKRSVNRSHMVENPQFENAKGMYLMLRYLLA